MTFSEVKDCWFPDVEGRGLQQGKLEFARQIGGKNFTCGMDFALEGLLFILHRCLKNYIKYSRCFLGVGTCEVVKTL